MVIKQSQEMIKDKPWYVSDDGKKDTKDLARGAGANYFGYLMRLMARFPFLFLAGVLYGEARFGQYTFAIALMETLAAFAVFGLKGSIFKFLEPGFLKRHRTNVSSVVATALGLSLMIVLGFMGLLILVLTGVYFYASNISLLRILFLLIPVLPFIVVADVLLSATRNQRIMRYDIISRSVLEPLFLTTCTLLFYFSGWHDYGLAMAYLVSLGAASFSAVFFYSRAYSLRELIKAPIDFRLMNVIARFSGPTALFDVMKFLFTRVDIFVVTWFCPVHIVGIYGMAAQISTLIKKIRQGFDAMLGPVVAQALASNERKKVNASLETVSRWVLTLQLPLLLFMIFYGGRVLGLMGEGFSTGTWILIFLVSADVINGTFGVSEWPTLFLKPGLNPLITGGSLVLYVGLSAILVHLTGPQGAALALLVVYTALNGTRMAFNGKLFGIPGMGKTLLKPFVAGIVSFIVLYGITRGVAYHNDVQLILGITWLLSGYPLVLMLLGLEPEDRFILNRVIGRVRHRLMQPRLSRAETNQIYVPEPILHLTGSNPGDVKGNAVESVSLSDPNRSSKIERFL